MRTTTLRLPEQKLKLLKAIAGFEGSSMSKILEQMSIPGFVQECRSGYEEVKAGGGKRLDELDD
jgi:hypothetical protein